MTDFFLCLFTSSSLYVSLCPHSFFTRTAVILNAGLPAAAKSLQSCPTLCDPKDGSPPGSPVPGILQARTLEWVAISFSKAWKWKVKIESEVAQPCPTQWSHGLQPTRLLCPWDFPGKSTGVGCHCLLQGLPKGFFLAWFPRYRHYSNKVTFWDPRARTSTCEFWGNT